MRFALLSLTLVSLGLAQELAVENPQNPVVKIATNRGEIFIELFPDEAPKTVENFVDLAEGRREFTDPKTGEKLKRPYYDGLTFHRVIEGFMIQGGCPLGDGSGGPGYTFADEINADTLGLAALRLVQKEGTIHPWLLVRNEDDFRRLVLFPLCRAMGILSNEDFQSRQPEVVAKLESISVKDAYENLGYVFTPRIKSRPPTKAVIAMANAGPNTNGSQFFINLDDTPHLTGKHTVFGRVVKGMDVVEAIGKTATDDRDRPTEAVVIESIRLIKP